MKFVPHNYQAYCIDYIKSHPVSALFLTMGLSVATGETVPTAVLPLCDHRGISAPRKSAKDIGAQGLCPQTPEVYRLVPQRLNHRYLLRATKYNKKSDTVWHRPFGSQLALGSLLSVALSSDC